MRHRRSFLWRIDVGGCFLAVGRCGICAALAYLAAANAPSASSQEQETDAPQARLIDRPAFDRIVLTPQAGGESVEVQPLELPEGRIPDPLPKEGSLSVYRVSEPSIEYEVAWASIDRIEKYEAWVLQEAQRLTSIGVLDEAFEFLAYLHKYYPDAPGLDSATQTYLWRDAGTAFSAGNAGEALPILMSLYDENPSFPRLANAVQVISDSQIARLLKQEKYGPARSTVDMLEQAFPELSLANLAKWRAQFQADAERELATARQAIARSDYKAARRAVRHAQAILPTAPGADDLLSAIERAAPEMRVGVSSLATLPLDPRLPTWDRTRLAALVEPTLVTLVGFGAEGGVYASRWGDIVHSDDGRQTSLRLSPAAIAQGLTPAAISLLLLHRADPASPSYDVDFASYLAGVETSDGQAVILSWKRPHIRPAALLQAPLKSLEPQTQIADVAFQQEAAIGPETLEMRYQRAPRNALQNNSGRDVSQPGGPGDVGPEQEAPTQVDGGPLFVVEQALPDDEAALQALMRGDVDVLEKIPPWQLVQARQSPGVIVESYRLPTLHALILRPGRPLLEMREFRRALCYGIDRAQIVRDILLGGREEPGFQPVSGPFLAGVSLGDPVGYAYNAQLEPRLYQPRLAVVLAGVARETLSRQQARQQALQSARLSEGEGAADVDAPAPVDAAAEGAGRTPAEPEANVETEAQPATNLDDGASMTEEQEATPPQPLRLLHTSDPLARLACQTIQLQLLGVGIPVELVESPPSGLPADIDFDLAYVELTIWDPIVAARELLGPGGAAGRSTSFMNLVLDELSASQNWNQARQLLKEIHRIARADLPFIPLWQTTNYFAHRDWLTGMGTQPATLYQNLEAWQKRFSTTGR